MGSPTGMWTSVSGGMAQSQNMDTIANNLANSNTAGFKKDTPSFKEHLTIYEKIVDPQVDIPRTQFKDADFYPTDGKEHAFVNVDRVHTDHSQGNLKMTEAPLDFAIDGPGFFAIKTPSGTQFTRAGNFKLDAAGKIVTMDGHPLLGGGVAVAPDAANQTPAAAPETTPNPLAAAQALGANAQRAPAATNPFSGDGSALQEISLKDFLSQGKKVHISESGQVFVGEQEITKIAIAEFVDPKLLRKVSSTQFDNPNPANVPKFGNKSKVIQGALELSNVNSVAEISELIRANRMFESNMRAIKAYNEMSAKEANEVGKL